MENLQKYGLRGQSGLWFRSYLDGRISVHRLTMSTLQARGDTFEERENENITTRRGKHDKGKSAVTPGMYCAMSDGSLFIDSILSRDEMDDIYNMLETEDNVSRKFDLFTSTQMGQNKRNKPSLDLSPIGPQAGRGSSVTGNDSILLNNRFAALLEHEGVLNHLNKVDSEKLGSQKGGKKSEENNGEIGDDGLAPGTPDAGPGCLDDLKPGSTLGSGVQGTGEVSKHSVAIGQISVEVGNEDTAGGALVSAGSTEIGAVVTPNSKSGTSVGMQGSGGAGQMGQVLEDNGDNEDGDEGSASDSDTAKVSGDDDGELGGNDYNSKLEMVSLLLNKIDGKSEKLAHSVKELQESLEFSQKEIDTLKIENLQLKKKLNDIDTEERRTVYQIKKVEEKIDRVDTANKKRNLVLDGLMEVDGGKEDVDKTVWNALTRESNLTHATE